MNAAVAGPSSSSLLTGKRLRVPFRAPGASPVLAHLYLPTGLSASTRVVVVMHGTLRNAHEYIEGWTAWAERADRVVVAPNFDHAAWPGNGSYQSGNVLRGDGSGAPNPEPGWAFTVVEAIHEWIRDGLGLDDPHFTLWGHSAGAQFVHRFLLFKPQAKVSAAIAAGCGWFTVPDLGTRFPYGLDHPSLPFGEHDARRYVHAPLALLRGTWDTTRDSRLRTTAGAEAQGRNRYERAGHMLRAAKRVDPTSNWRLLDVPGVGHDWTGMAPVAQSLLEEG